MKTKTILSSHRADLQEFTETYRPTETPAVELCGVSFGHEPIEYASSEDIARYRGKSALNELERAVFILAAQTRWNRR
jgi:hypothetical protein